MNVLRAIANVPAGTNFLTLVNGTAGKKIRVVALDLQAGGVATDVTFYNEVTAISALYALGANGGKTLPLAPEGWFETEVSVGAGVRLRVKTGAGSAVAVTILYILVNENGTP